MRPANLLYGVDDKPPLSILVLSTAQQTAATAAISFATMIAVLDAAHADLDTTSNALRVSMIALGLVTLLHCMRWGPLGSGYLVPAVFATSYLPGMMMAAAEGGLPLVFGMIMFAGVVQALMATALPRLRPFFPTEITGFVVFMIGLGMGVIGIRAMVGASAGSDLEAHAPEALLGLGTLAVIVTISVWSKGPARTFSVLIGIVAGYGGALAAGLLDVERLSAGWGGTLFNFPRLMAQIPAFSWSPTLMLPFVVGALACSLRSIGDVTTSQKINDTDWRRPDMKTIEGAILACGLGNILSGLIGSIGSNTSSSGVGLAGATGVTARRVGYAMAGLLMALAFIPGLASLLAVMPRPVLGAVMMFSGCLVIMNGLQMVMSRVIDMRKTLVVGVSMVLGIGHDIFPQLFSHAPVWMQPFVESSVVMSIVTALLLNFVFRLGVRKIATASFAPGPQAAEQMYRFAHGHGGTWAARQDVIQRVIRALSEFAENAGAYVAAGELVVVSASFDEYLLTVELAYNGRPFEVARAVPTEDEMLEDEGAMVRLSSILVARAADRLTIKSDGEAQRVMLTFNH
jgi:NCS2 family nucleobase:cation symporter-2